MVLEWLSIFIALLCFYVHVCVCEQVDIFSYGLLLFTLMTNGHRPFEELSVGYERDKAIKEVVAIIYFSIFSTAVMTSSPGCHMHSAFFCRHYAKCAFQADTINFLPQLMLSK